MLHRVSCLSLLLVWFTSEAQPTSQSRKPIREWVGVQYPVDTWPNCTIGSRGVQGTCQKVVQCGEAVEVILRGYHPPICYWERYKTFPLVCCPSLGHGTLDDVLPPLDQGPQTTLTQKEVNRVCGLNEARLFIEDDEDEDEHSHFVPIFRPKPKREAKQEPKWPWMVSIYSETDHKFVCNGFMIDNQHVLTAARQFDKDRSKTFVVAFGSQEHRVSKVVVHDDYKTWSQYNDLALLTLSEPLTEVMPLCLPSRDLDINDVIGYNSTILGTGGQSYEHVPVVSHSWCQEMYSKYSPLTYPKGITDQFICAGLQLKDTPSSGQGDLGGPVMIQKGDRWMAIGLVSLDYKCANQGFPGVYINLAKYADWIDNHINQ